MCPTILADAVSGAYWTLVLRRQFAEDSTATWTTGPFATDVYQHHCAAGVNFRHAASKTSHKYLLETMGAGVAILDYDNDGRMDLFFTNGGGLKDPMPKDELPDKSHPRYWDRLFRQNNDGKFTDVTERSGLKGVGYSMGAAAADYDNDGYVDLFVSGYKADRLYRNNGDGTFVDVTSRLRHQQRVVDQCRLARL